MSEERQVLFDQAELQAQWEALSSGARKDVRRAVFLGRRVAEPATAGLAVEMSRNVRPHVRKLAYGFVAVVLVVVVILVARPPENARLWLVAIPSVLAAAASTLVWRNTRRAEELNRSLNGARSSFEAPILTSVAEEVPQTDAAWHQSWEALGPRKQQFLRRTVRRGAVAPNPEDAWLAIALSLREQQSAVALGVVTFLFGLAIAIFVLLDRDNPTIEWGIVLAVFFGLVSPGWEAFSYVRARRAERVNAELAAVITGVDYRSGSPILDALKTPAYLAGAALLIAPIVVFGQWAARGPDDWSKLGPFLVVGLLWLWLFFAAGTWWDAKRKGKNLRWGIALRTGGIGIVIVALVVTAAIGFMILVYPRP